MAPEADIVFIGMTDDFDEEQMMEYMEDEEDIIELVFAFATAYAGQSGQPMVFSGSMNSQSGPHNGTGTVPEAIDAASETIIPVMSAGNEGGYPIHLHRVFTERNSSFKTLLALMEEGETFTISDETVGYTCTGDRVSIKVGLCTVNALGRTKEVWNSEELTATIGCEPQIINIESEDNATLSKYFDGTVSIAALDNGDGTLSFATNIDGSMNGLNIFQLTVSGSNGTEIDIWDDFGGFNIFGLPGCERVQITDNTLFVKGNANGIGNWTGGPGLTSAMELRFDFGHANVTDYARGLDFDTARAWVRYSSAGVGYSREYFASYPARALVARFVARDIPTEPRAARRCRAPQ